MEIRQLRSFVQIVDLGSFTRAAQRLNVAQPALSQQIAALETELEVQLLVRSPRGARPTEAGKALYRQARLILRQTQDAGSIARAAGRAVAGTVSLGLPTSTCTMIALPLIEAVRRRHPLLRLQLTESPSAHLTELTLNGRLDLAVLSLEAPTRGLRALPLLEERLFFVEQAGAAPAAAGRLRRISWKEVVQHPLALPSRPNPLRLRVDSALAGLGLEAQVAVEVNSMGTLAELVCTGQACSILAWSAVGREALAGRLKLRELAAPGVSRQLLLCRPDTANADSAILAVQALVFDTVAQLVGEGVWRGARLPPGGLAAEGPAGHEAFADTLDFREADDR